jgi:hypothetical protein
MKYIKIMIEYSAFIPSKDDDDYDIIDDMDYEIENTGIIIQEELDDIISTMNKYVKMYNEISDKDDKLEFIRNRLQFFKLKFNLKNYTPEIVEKRLFLSSDYKKYINIPYKTIIHF